MPANHTEKAFENAIEHHLLTETGYTKADPGNFDRERCIDPTVLLPFIEETQADLWQSLKSIHGPDTEAVLLDDLCKTMDSQGCLNVLRHGFKCFGKPFRVAHFAPASGMNPDTQRLYAANRLTVTRQVHYSSEHENSIDLVLSLNGIPVATAELKNPLTGQNVQHAITQYKNDRSHRDLMFQFRKRTLVHFAVDPNEVYMTTRLSGSQTTFLPFNLGNAGGKGNPDSPDGYKTAYLWEQVWERDSLLDILARFVHLQVEEKKVNGKKVRKEVMLFPRYHQLDCVRQMVDDARVVGAGKNYLIQHSAGSGKSNSIAWLAHRLASLYNDDDEKVFDSVVVVTDRVVLDKQLHDTIYQFEHKQGVVVKVDAQSKSTQLAEALASGTPIIIVTIQTFPFVTEKAAELPSRKYAVIVDEAHSSQSGETATELKGVLAADAIKQEAERQSEEQHLVDYEEEILKTMLKRGQQPNISFFAFTATPKYKTLEVFGQLGPDLPAAQSGSAAQAGGKPQPFHLYSMRQAIEEGFILDVLKHYTTYATYFGLIKSIEDDPEVDKRKAARALARFMSLHPHNIAQKTEVTVEHFRHFTRHKIGGKAKAMVVTGSRLHAVRYKQAFDKYIAEKEYTGMGVLVAFSGAVQDPDVPDVEYTEVGMNGGIKEKELPDKFAAAEYHVLIVAEKYQTGFDQPLLHTMYVDKRLSGVQAVQTLSRLNRTHAGKEDTFILDFVNGPEEIYKAFKPYYEAPAIGDRADHRQLYDLQAKMDEEQVYHRGEVEGFCEVYFKARAKLMPQDHAMMNAYLDPAVNRFSAREEDKRDEFRKLLQAFKNLYSFLSQIIPFQDSDLEKLFTYVRFLIRKLPAPDTGPTYHLDDDVQLKYYRLQKIGEGSIPLTGESEPIYGPTDRGTGSAHPEMVELSRVIDLLNARFGTQFMPADELLFEQIQAEAVSDPDLQQSARVNTLDNFRHVFDPALEGIFVDRMDDNADIFARFMNEAEFRQIVQETLRRRVYDEIRGEDAAD